MKLNAEIKITVKYNENTDNNELSIECNRSNTVIEYLTCLEMAEQSLKETLISYGKKKGMNFIQAKNVKIKDLES